MIEEDAVEGTIDTIVDVVEHLLLFALCCGVSATRMNGCGESHGGSCKVAAGFTNDANVGREELVQQGSHDLGDFREGRRVVVGSRESTSNVEEGEVETVGGSEVESSLGEQQRVVVGSGRETTAANVEANANKINVEVDSSLEENGPNLSRSSEFGSKLAERVRIVREDSHDELGFRKESLDLLQLVDVVESHHLHAFLLSVGDVEGMLARVGEDDVLLVAGHQLLDKTHLVLGGAVEAGSEIGQGAEDGRVWVAFHGWQGEERQA